MGKRVLPAVLTDVEEKALLSQFNDRYPTSQRNGSMIKLSLKTGMRISELINLKWADIEFDPQYQCYSIHIKQGKGKKDRMIYIPVDLYERLSMLKNRFPSDNLVFCTLKGDKIKDSYLRKMIADKASKAEINKSVHFHLLRHTYLTKLYKQTNNIRTVQETAGHADISTTMIYTHISNNDVRQAMLSLSDNKNAGDNEDPDRLFNICNELNEFVTGE